MPRDSFTTDLVRGYLTAAAWVWHQDRRVALQLVEKAAAILGGARDSSGRWCAPSAW